jgi:CRP-like cAMP-binding protein
VLAAYDVEQRFFRFLLQQFGRKEEYVVPLSKKDFAAAIGTIPETLSRLLLRLKKEGKAVWEKNVIRLRKGFWERASEYKEGT